MTDSIYLTNIRTVPPAYSVAQSTTLEWLANAHTRSEATRASQSGTVVDEVVLRERMTQILARVACGEDKIATRGIELADCTHTRWSEMQIYRLLESPQGLGMASRTNAYVTAVGDVIAKLYADDEVPAPDMIHVTCTGYASPSALQRLVSARGWGRQTRVTHAYHMGCYATLPALRTAVGFALLPDALREGTDRRVEIVHTEICSLHLNPQLHSPEQFVIQSLFADGFVAYAVHHESSRSAGPSFSVLAVAEEVVPDSSGSMQWVCADWGMQMVLARDVPERLISTLDDFVSRLGVRAAVGRDELARAQYAIHPGGPRILDFVQGILKLEEAQIAHSRMVLRAHGNMSSATLPHVWKYMLDDPALPHGQLVVSLAFGPGLTVSGALMRKVLE